MRHRKKIPKLSRKADHRKALLRNLATSLVLKGKIKTTNAKAKALVSYIERLIRLAQKAEPMNAIRMIKRHLFTEPAQKAFIKQLENRKRESGNVRVVKLGTRVGDRAEMSLVEFV